ncbi:MAG TPA: polyamine aminopropyltransferase [Thermoanaerobacterales bacterium]|nr:polyamine aminopropyltransferase [Thermoanaerobacterales bacterium]
MELWFSEYQTKNTKLSFRVKEVLYTKQSKFQNISVIETEDFGRVLALDDTVMLTTKDEFVYHEMISHVPLLTHGNASRVLVIGGGDGGTIREILKHPVKEAHLVEIDREVIETSKEYFPSVSCGLSDPRVKIFCEDGIEFVKKNKGYDIVIIDSTDPIGPAVGLFSEEFYKDVFLALNENGIMVAQTETPILFGDLIKRIYNDMSSVFHYTNLYSAVIPTYPGAFWTFTMGSKTINPISHETSVEPFFKTKYYNKKLHRSYFILPPFVKDIISE